MRLTAAPTGLLWPLRRPACCGHCAMPNATKAELALQAHEALHAKRQAQDESECALQQANQECAELRRALGDAEERAEAMQAELLTLRPRSATITSEVCSCRPAPPSPIPALRPCDAL